MENRREDEDRLLDHEYDGIHEYDNPLPRWWIMIFYATIVYSVLYYFNVPGIGPGKGRIANYERDVAAAEVVKKANAPPAADEATLLAASSDPAAIGRGKTVFTGNCSPCHRMDGGGSIGPNLTDDYWIHGSRPLQVHRIVNEGVLDKGMPAWGQTLASGQVMDVVAYVLSLKDTHPESPKAPQGVKEEEGGEHDHSASGHE